MSDSKPSRRDLLCAGGTLAAGAMLEGLLPCHAADLPFMAVTAESVRRAIQRGCEFLRRRQQPDGTWPNRPRYADGLTALCVLALLQAGYPPTDPVVQRGLDWLRGYVPDSTYTASFQTMVLCSAQPERDLMQIQRNVRWVESR